MALVIPGEAYRPMIGRTRPTAEVHRARKLPLNAGLAGCFVAAKPDAKERAHLAAPLCQTPERDSSAMLLTSNR
jgi:hypothetical protein